MESALDIQTRAVLREYREALEDEHFALAHRIWNANPDLHKALLQVNDEWCDERGVDNGVDFEDQEYLDYYHTLEAER